MTQMKVYTQGHISIFNKFNFNEMGPVIDPNVQFSGNNRIFVKISALFIYVCFNNDCVIAQNTSKCVENGCDENYHIFVLLTISSFSVTLIITLKTVCFLVKCKIYSLVRPGPCA